MATADPMTQVNEILKCVICWESFTDPRQLHCGHVFCFECINTHFKTYGKNCAPCPVCRQLYWPKDRDANNLPKSTLPLRQLLAIQHTTNRSCETSGCNQNKTPYLCLTCRQWLCDACKSQTCIVDNDGNIAHNAFLRSDIDPGLFDIVKRSRHKQCYMHHSHEVEWYCLQCRMLLCKLCQTNSHLHHTLIDIVTQSRDTRENLEQTAALLQKKQQQHRHDLEMYEELQIVVKVELFNASDCQKVMAMCSRDIDNCDKIIQLITQLLKFGSDVVIIDTYRNLEERIETELGQCHSLGPLLTELNSRTADNNHTTATWVDACRGDKRKHLISDSGVDDLSVSEGSLEEGVPPEDNSCEIFNCVSSTQTKLLCLSCMKWICEVCSRRCCLKNDSDSKHDVLPVADVDRHLYDVIMRNRNYSCKSHPTNDVRLFCTKCNIPLCTTCRVNGHLDHPTIKISDRSQVCCRKLKVYEGKLQKQVQDYKTTRHKFLEMQNSPCAEALNPSYCENISSRCESGIDACEDFVKRITFLLHYGSPSVIVDGFLELKYHIEKELRVCPSDFATPLRQLVCFISATLDQANSCVDDVATSDDEADIESTSEEVVQGITGNGPESNTTNTPVVNGPESNTTNTPVVNGPESNTTDTPMVNGLESNTTDTPVVNGPGSNTSDTPVVNGSVSSASNNPVVNRRQNNASVRRRVTSSVCNAASEMPNNPNSTEESNAWAHVSYVMWIWEQIKVMCRYLSRFLSDS
ncbi:uncharacterized protein LOC110449107 [Mizuhopecten yessoensis]|uniref:uncharacterized protein LOC110449107 n=1 Tax=Mizuhopecten yessoensis TaxID=6573 RepID=UPI000B45A19E|nr:uncharacterized protein LOC110449107 [Mizuhopecten yessoensis]